MISVTILVSAPIAPIAEASALPLVRLSQALSPLPHGSKDIGPLKASQPVTIHVVLPPSNTKALSALLANQYSSASPQYHQWLAPGQFASQFGPSPALLSATSSWLTGQGFSNITTTNDEVTATAPAATAGNSLGVSFESYRTKGVVAFAANQPPLLPASLASDGARVLGLDTFPLMSPSLEMSPRRAATSNPATSNPAPCSTASNFASAYGFYTPDQVGAAYGVKSLLSNGQNGNGQNIALFELGQHSPSDVATYKSCFGLSNSTTTQLVDGGAQPDSGGTAEADADFEEAATLAPAASLTYYEGPNSLGGSYDTWNAIVSNDTSSVVSTSWGFCELGAQMGGSISSYDPLFEQAAAQGQSVMSASGDSGSEGCFPVNTSTTTYTQYPASDPWVTGVGGTSLLSPGDEVAWNDCQFTTSSSCAFSGGGAGGGGLSRYVTRPSWQPADFSWGSSSNPCGTTCREVPDISANAGVGQTYFVNGVWGAAGGTSVAAPLIAAMTADRDVNCRTPTGDLAPTLYSLAAGGVYGTALNQVTAGDNDLTRTYGGADYPAGTGYNLATGLGSPEAAGLSCAEVTGISATSGTAGESVTITGLGLESATISFGSTAATTVSSASSTSITVKVPAGSGTPAVSATSPEGSGTETVAFSYLGPPTLSSISPQSGPSSGQTEVTITGSGFSTGSAVAFGSMSATAVTVASATQIIATSPAGSGTMDITVTTGAGTTPTSPADKFTYSPPASGPYSAVVPVRICDTRPGNPSQLSGQATQCNGTGNAGDTLVPGHPISPAVAGNFGVPGNATAAVFNVTSVNTSARTGYLTVFPTDQTIPTASNLNFSPDQTVPNLVDAAIGAGGEVSFVSDVPVDIVVDLEGYVSPTSLGGAGLFNALSVPSRICDSRSGNPSLLAGGATQCSGAGNAGTPLAPGIPANIEAVGLGGVPTNGVSAVILNVTVTGSSGSGYLTVYPQGNSHPTASNLNFSIGQTIPNRVIVPVGPTGQVSLYSDVHTNFIVDVSGWFSATGGSGVMYTADAAPTRICDTRVGNPSGLTGGASQCNGTGNSGAPIGPHQSLTLNVARLGGVPTGATAVVLNVTAIYPTASTYLAIFPGNVQTGISDLNPIPGGVEPNLVAVAISASGTVTVFNNIGTVGLVVDVAGYYQ